MHAFMRRPTSSMEKQCLLARRTLPTTGFPIPGIASKHSGSGIHRQCWKCRMSSRRYGSRQSRARPSSFSRCGLMHRRKDQREQMQVVLGNPSRSSRINSRVRFFEEPERTPEDCHLRHLPGTKDTRSRSQAKRQVARVLYRARRDVQSHATRRGRAALVRAKDQGGADCDRAAVEELTPEDLAPGHSPPPSRAD